MNEDYLWDGSGEKDPEVARLQRLLAPLRHQGGAAPAPALPLMVRRPRRQMAYAALAAAGLGLGVLLFLPRSPRFLPGIQPPPPVKRATATPQAGPEGSPAAVVALVGTPKLATHHIAAETPLILGAWLETDETSRARIEIPKLGVVEVTPRSRIRLVEASPRMQRLELAQGTILAKMIAPPRLFIIDTPSAAAVDLGCAYRLEVDPRGDGRIHVTAGYVSLESRGRSSLVPAGATCEMRKAQGPGTPYFVERAAALKDALMRLDFAAQGAKALGEILHRATARDTLTLWHLLSRVDPAQRQAVFARLHALAKLPPELRKKDVLTLSPTALDAWRQSLAKDW